MYFKKRDYGGAIENFDRAILLDDKYWIAYNNRGNLMYFTGDFASAIQDFDIAIAINPKCKIACHSRKKLRKALDGVDKVERELKFILK